MKTIAIPRGVAELAALTSTSVRYPKIAGVRLQCVGDDGAYLAEATNGRVAVRVRGAGVTDAGMPAEGVSETTVLAKDFAQAVKRLPKPRNRCEDNGDVSVALAEDEATLTGPGTTSKV